VCSFEYFSECSFETQSPVLHADEVLKRVHESYHMLIARVMIVPAENSDGIRNIRLRSGHCVLEDSDLRLVSGRIAGFLIWLPLLNLHSPRRGSWSGLMHSEHRQDRPNVAVLMHVDLVMLPIAFDVHAEIDGDSPKIMHPEPLLQLVLNLPNPALVSTDEEMIDVQKSSRQLLCFDHDYRARIVLY
jgi:hypothetical protein